ncbi:MAG: TIGR02147 family protein [Chitinivibrionales bacterium]|nr:TIGR02147 family protein [Chitinivibrionales bacterium]
MESIYRYTDYRKYLYDAYRALKKERKGLSYAVIAQEAGFRSNGYVTQIFKGIRPISNHVAEAFTRIFSLRKSEKAYFFLMIAFNQAATEIQRYEAFQNMLNFRQSNIHFIDPSNFEIFSRWYYIAVRELLNFYPFDGDYRKLGQLLIPKISEADAKRAVKMLLKHKLISREPGGSFKLINKIQSTGFDEHPYTVNNFVIETVERMRDALAQVDKNDRVISSVTGSVSDNTYNEIMSKMHAFRREILEMVRKDTGISRVCQVNMQLFPLSKSIRRVSDK